MNLAENCLISPIHLLSVYFIYTVFVFVIIFFLCVCSVSFFTFVLIVEYSSSNCYCFFFVFVFNLFSFNFLLQRELQSFSCCLLPIPRKVRLKKRKINLLKSKWIWPKRFRINWFSCIIMFIKVAVVAVVAIVVVVIIMVAKNSYGFNQREYGTTTTVNNANRFQNRKISVKFFVAAKSAITEMFFACFETNYTENELAHCERVSERERISCGLDIHIRIFRFISPSNEIFRFNKINKKSIHKCAQRFSTYTPVQS